MSVCLAQKQNNMLSAAHGFRSRGLTTHLDHSHLLQHSEGNFQRLFQNSFKHKTNKRRCWRRDIDCLGVTETGSASSKLGHFYWTGEFGGCLRQKRPNRNANETNGRSFPRFLFIRDFEFLTPFLTMPLKRAKNGDEWPELVPKIPFNSFNNF